MKKPRDTCKRCGIELEGRELSRSLCLRCAKRELGVIKRYFQIRPVVGVVLAVLFFLLLGRVQISIENMSPTSRNSNLDAIAAMSTAQRALWGVMAFTVPFGYIHQVKAKGAPVNEARRTEILTRSGSPGFGLASNGIESIGVGFFIAGIVTAPVVGPVYAVYRIARAISLRRYLAGEAGAVVE